MGHSVPVVAPARLRDTLGDECGICLAPLWAGNTEVCATSCFHLFHRECAVEALEHRAQCPTCRQPQSSDSLRPVILQENGSIDVGMSGPELSEPKAPERKKRRTGLWTDAEDSALRELHAQHGNTWKMFTEAFNFHGKSPMQLKDRMRVLAPQHQ